MSQAGDYGVTRRASSATSSVPKASCKLLLQNDFLQPVSAMNDNSSVMASLQDKVVYVQFLVSQLRRRCTLHFHQLFFTVRMMAKRGRGLSFISPVNAC